MRKAALMTFACVFALAAGAVQMASQPWVTNRIAEAEARVGAEDAQTYTNAVNAAKEYADGKIAALPVIGDYANVSNRAVNAAPMFKDSELISCAWAVAQPSVKLQQTTEMDGRVVWTWAGVHLVRQLTYDGKWLYRYFRVMSPIPDWQYTNTSSRAATELMFSDDIILTRCDEVWGGGTNNPVAYMDDLSRAADAATNYTDEAIANIDIPDPDLSAYATKSELGTVTDDLSDLRTESSLVYRLYSGSNVVAEVTNYNSTVHAPTLRLMQLNESNEYVTVWTETNGLARTFRDATNYTDGAIAAYAAPRAWSRTTSGLGADAPQDTTWISTPRTVIAGGFEYAKVVDTYGEVWVLSSNGMGVDFNPDTNAYFRITADDGTPVFSIEKADAQVVGAYAEGITVSANSVTMPVPVVSAEAPTMCWSDALESGVWADQSSPPTGATVNWSGSAGTWVCTVTFSGTRPSKMFFRFSFLQEGGVKIRNNAALEVSSGILCTDGIHKVRPVYNNGTITWEVVP